MSRKKHAISAPPKSVADFYPQGIRGIRKAAKPLTAAQASAHGNKKPRRVSRSQTRNKLESFFSDVTVVALRFPRPLGRANRATSSKPSRFIRHWRRFADFHVCDNLRFSGRKCGKRPPMGGRFMRAAACSPQIKTKERQSRSFVLKLCDDRQHHRAALGRLEKVVAHRAADRALELGGIAPALAAEALRRGHRQISEIL